MLIISALLVVVLYILHLNNIYCLCLKIKFINAFLKKKFLKCDKVLDFEGNEAKEHSINLQKVIFKSSLYT